MTGKVLQERIAAVTDIPFNIIAEKIGVSAQSMYQFFTAKDVKSGLIEKVCEVLDIDIATLYGQLYGSHRYLHTQVIRQYQRGEQAGGGLHSWLKVLLKIVGKKSAQKVG